MTIAIIDEELCIACGQCEDICPEVFEIEDQTVTIISDDITDETKDACYEAAETCPVNAITIEEEE